MNYPDLANFLSFGSGPRLCIYIYTLVPVVIIYLAGGEEISNNHYNLMTSQQVFNLLIQNRMTRTQKIKLHLPCIETKEL